MTEETSFVFEATGRCGTGREFETPFPASLAAVGLPAAEAAEHE